MAYLKVVFKNLLTRTEENDEDFKLVSTLTKNQSRYHQNISQKYHCLFNMHNEMKIYFVKPFINDIYTYVVQSKSNVLVVNYHETRLFLPSAHMTHNRDILNKDGSTLSISEMLTAVSR